MFGHTPHGHGALLKALNSVQSLLPRLIRLGGECFLPLLFQFGISFLTLKVQIIVFFMAIGFSFEGLIWFLFQLPLISYPIGVAGVINPAFNPETWLLTLLNELFLWAVGLGKHWGILHCFLYQRRRISKIEMLVRSIGFVLHLGQEFFERPFLIIQVVVFSFCSGKSWWIIKNLIQDLEIRLEIYLKPGGRFY